MRVAFEMLAALAIIVAFAVFVTYLAFLVVVLWFVGQNILAIGVLSLIGALFLLINKLAK